jgi:hypothetical protein
MKSINASNIRTRTRSNRDMDHVAPVKIAVILMMTAYASI